MAPSTPRTLAVAALLAVAATPAQAPDADRPQVRLHAPSYASDRSTNGSFELRWRGSDRGSGIARYRLEARPNAIVTAPWRTVARTRRTRVGFHGRAGITYVFRLRARDRAGNLSDYDYAESAVPLDDSDPRARRDPGWRRIAHRTAWQRTITRVARRGRELSLSFEGTRVALIASRHRRGATLLVSVAGRLRAVSLRGRHRHRQAVFRSQRLVPGPHLLRIRTVDDGTADIDGFAVDAGPDPPHRR